MALKLQQGVITVDRKAVTTKSGPKDIRLHMSASVQDIMIQDMRVSREFEEKWCISSVFGYPSVALVI